MNNFVHYLQRFFSRLSSFGKNAKMLVFATEAVSYYWAEITMEDTCDHANLDITAVIAQGSCLYWHEENEAWEEDGCQVSGN